MTRDEFMELVYETFADEPDNVLANGIIEAADAYAEHEKAQLFSEGTTSDLISRTETVKRLRRMLEATVTNTDYDEGFVDGIEFAISTASTMPTIQPQSTAGQPNDGVRSTARSTDLIDRQQTLDALIGAVKKVGILDADDIKAVFDMLPTIQPIATDTNVGDTISRQAVIDAVEKNACNTQRIMDAVNNLPSTQPEPQEGHWIGKYPTTHICSECGWLIPDSKVKVFAYCPNCGAKMTISTK